MNLYRLLTLILLLSCSHIQAQHYNSKVSGWKPEEAPDTLQLVHSIFLIGDLGEGSPVKPMLNFLKKELSRAGKKGTVLFLGNDIARINDGNRNLQIAHKAAHLDVLTNLVEDFPGGLFILPGAKKWGRERTLNWQTFKKQENRIEQTFNRGDIVQPSGGCPGPVEIALSDEIVLILVNSQWMLYRGDRPMEECAFKSTSNYLIILNDVIKRNRNKKIVFASYHPIFSAGKYGGHFPFPGPIELYRKMLGTPQDFSHPFYSQMRYYIQNLFRGSNDVIFVSAHENNLQYIRQQQIHQIIAGSGSTAEYVAPGKTDFAGREIGFGCINFYKNNEAWLEFWGAGREGNEPPRLIFQKHLFTRKVVPPEELALQYQKLDFSDSLVTVPASVKYKTDSKFKKRMLGQNYRNEWLQPIQAPVFDIAKEQGGLEILKLGGGQQTRSLRLKDKKGKQYVLRSIEKYTEKAIPRFLRGTFAAALLQDGISGSHPYAALAVPKLADAANVLHVNPKIVYVPNDPRFGIYQDDFKNGLYLFEEWPDENTSETLGFGNFKKIISTEKVLENLYESTYFRIDEQAVLRARLLDIFINDWDRHEDQWRWAVFQQKGDMVAQPVPRDRDQVFFYNEGVLPWIIRRKWAMRKFQPLDTIVHDVVGLGFNSRFFDRSFLSSLSRLQWENMAIKLQASFTDGVIEAAVRDMPPEVVKLSGETIIQKLKTRRDKLPGMADDFYTFLARKVDVTGTNERENFKIARKPDGSLHVEMHRLNKKGNLKNKLFDRTFVYGETREVCLYGLGGKDKFQITGEGKKGIRLRIIGGPGHDILENNATGLSRRSTWVYDKKTGIEFNGNKHFMNRTREQAKVNLYNRKSFKYDVVSPAVNMNFVRGDGLVLGAGVAVKKQKFRKTPYASLHRFVANYAFNYPSVKLDYRGEVNSILGQNDLILNFNYNTPNFQGYYFGLGNNTRDLRPDNDDDEYNRTRMFRFFLHPMLRKRIMPRHNLAIGLFYQRTRLQATANRFVTDTLNPFYDLDSRTDFNVREYWGFNLNYTFDSRNSKVLPSRGMFWEASFKRFIGVEPSEKNFYQLQTDLRFYLSLGLPQRTVLALRAGAAHNSQGYPFFLANKLGLKTNLRGYREDRFAGDDMVYQNTDLRFRLLRFHTYLLVGELGVLGFNDFGRVYLKGEDSDRWHHGYGGGIWLSPFRLMTLTANFSHSREDNIFSVQFNYLF